MVVIETLNLLMMFHGTTSQSLRSGPSTCFHCLLKISLMLIFTKFMLPEIEVIYSSRSMRIHADGWIAVYEDVACSSQI